MVQATAERSSSLSTTAVTPSQVKSILLGDGWHEISNCRFTQFAISEGMSPPQPNKLYPAISYRDGKTNKQVVTPLSKILSFETSQ